MKTIVRNAAFLAVLALAAGIVAPGARAQQPSPPPGQGAPQPPGQLPQQPEAPKLNPEEEASYKAFFQLKLDQPQAVVNDGEAFLQKYPDSRYREAVYSRLVTAYQAIGQEQKMFAAGEKALELNPDNVDVLAVMAWAMPRRINLGELDADQKLQKAERYAKHAIELLSTVPKPEGMTDEAFAKARKAELASCHSGLGLVYYYQHNFPQMITELEQATQMDPSPDPVDFYLLGVAYQQAKRFGDAVPAFTRCSQTANPLQERCKASVEESKKRAEPQPAAPKP